MSSEGKVLEKPLKVEDLLQRNVFDVDEEAHIAIPSDDQSGIPKALTLLCPCGCYTKVGEKLLYSYEGCLECGLCRVISNNPRMKWEYPKSGRGVHYRFT